MSLNHLGMPLILSVFLGACFPSGQLKSSGSSQPQSTTSALTTTTDVVVKSSFGGEVSFGGSSALCSDTSGIASECTYSPRAGERIKVRAKPREGYVFLGWSGSCASDSEECEFTVGANQSIAAEFAEKRPLRIKTGDQIFETFKSITGVSDLESGIEPDKGSLRTLFFNARNTLPIANDPSGFTSQNQMSIVRLATNFCYRASELQQASNSFFPTSVIDFTGITSSTLGSRTLRQPLVNHLISRAWGSSDYEINPQGLNLSQAKADVEEYLAAIYSLLSDQDRNSAVGTKRLARAGCVAVLGAVATLAI